MRAMSGPNNYRESLLERLNAVRERIGEAASRAGRRSENVGLVAVTKTHPAEAVRTLFDLGQEAVGENRVQEFVRKHEALEGRGEWHFIGHLQRNKAAQVVGRSALIHSVDSVRLIEELEKRAAQKETVQRLLLEINTSGEAQKTGAEPEEAPRLVDALGAAPHLRGLGLMTMAPIVEDPEKARPAFARLRELMESLGSADHFEPRHLSMGMSGDFEAAIAEGATLVRVGTALMGERLTSPAEGP